MSEQRIPADPDTPVPEREAEPHDRPEVKDIPEVPVQPPPRRPGEVVPEQGPEPGTDEGVRP